MTEIVREVLIIGAGFAGLSAAIYLSRSRVPTLLIDSGHSMAVWEPEAQNYLGFPEGIAGATLLDRGRAQASRFGAEFAIDEALAVHQQNPATDRRAGFVVEGKVGRYCGKRLLIATGLTHLAPEIPGVRECLGKSLFFCKDCDAVRAQGGRLMIIGRNNEVVEYALAMLRFSPQVTIALNKKEPSWDGRHAAWLKEYALPVRPELIVEVQHHRGQLRAIGFETGQWLAVDYVFTTRGDIFHTDLAKSLGAALDSDGQIVVDQDMRSSVPGVYAAGCVTAANCQMIIAAGQGATAGQAINRDLFEDRLRTHTLLAMP
jgi:thioredoxin reductase (NADPH)